MWMLRRPVQPRTIPWLLPLWALYYHRVFDSCSVAANNRSRQYVCALAGGITSATITIPGSDPDLPAQPTFMVAVEHLDMQGTGSQSPAVG